MFSLVSRKFLAMRNIVLYSVFSLNIIRFLVLCGSMLLMNECHTYFFKTNRRANILFLFYVYGPAAMCNVIRIGVYVQSGTPKVSYLAPFSASFLAPLATNVSSLSELNFISCKRNQKTGCKRSQKTGCKRSKIGQFWCSRLYVEVVAWEEIVPKHLSSCR